MDINKMMTNGIFTMNGEHTQSNNKHNITDAGSGIYANILESLMTMCGC